MRSNLKRNLLFLAIVVALSIALFFLPRAIIIGFIEKNGTAPNNLAEYYFDWGFQHNDHLYAVVRTYLGYNEETGEPIYSAQYVIRLAEDEVNFDCKKFGLWSVCHSEDHTFMNFHGYYMSRTGMFSENGERYSSPADVDVDEWNRSVYRLFTRRQDQLQEQGITIIMDDIYTAYDSAICLPKMIFPRGESIDCSRD